MKKLFTLLLAFSFATGIFSQVPEKMNYQAVIRDASNNLVTDQAVGMQISILQGTASGTAVYVETQTPTANDNGLVSIEIGAGNVESGDFTTIDWTNGPYFIKTETDPDGGSTYSITGTSQLLSMPYAQHSKSAETVTGEITETDPVYGASVTSGIEANDIENWDNAYSDRLKWDGGSDGINATDGRTSLGLGSLAVLDQVPDQSIEAQQLAENSVNRDIAAPDITNYLVPVGTIVMWSGAIEEIPEGWLLCDGTEGTPDLRGRFIVGYDSEDVDYDVISAEGGANTHTLTLGQIPEHNHTAATGLAGGHTHSVELTTSSGGSHSHSATTSLSGMTKPMRLASSYRSTGYTSGTHSTIGLGDNKSYTYNPGASTTISPSGTHVHDISGDTDNASDHTHTVTIDNSGGGEAFDKRPPYFVLAYIIKIEN